MEVEREPAQCFHSNNELLICQGGGCLSEPSKVFVCSDCCFTKHNHGFMNFTRPSQFQKYCYKLDHLTYLKDDVKREVKTKFSKMREEIAHNLCKKEEFLLKKLDEILSEQVISTVFDCFIKGKIQPSMEAQSFEIVKEIRDISETREILEQCQKVVRDFSLNQKFLFNNNIFDLSSNDRENQDDEQSGQYRPPENLGVQQTAQQEMPMMTEEQNGAPPTCENDTIKAQNKEGGQSVRLKYIKQREQRHDGKVYINLEDINVPVEIRAKSFEDACSILKENLDSTDLSIYIQNSSIPEEEEESREEKKNIFLKELRELKNLQNLSLEIEIANPLSLDNLIDLELTLTSLQDLRQFRASYYVVEVEAFIYEYPNTRKKLGASNVTIKPRTSDSGHL